jgi:hypothetical protein
MARASTMLDSGPPKGLTMPLVLIKKFSTPISLVAFVLLIIAAKEIGKPPPGLIPNPVKLRILLSSEYPAGIHPP